MIQVIFTGLAHESYFDNEEMKATLREQLSIEFTEAIQNSNLVFNHFTTTSNNKNSGVRIFTIVSNLIEIEVINEFLIGSASDDNKFDSDDNKFDSEKYLDGVLDSRDKSLGIGGNYTFCIDLERQELKGNYVKMLHIPNLTKDAARKLFDLFDENNSPNGYEKIRIRLMEGDKEIDLNYIPNTHSHTT